VENYRLRTSTKQQSYLVQSQSSETAPEVLKSTIHQTQMNYSTAENRPVHKMTLLDATTIWQLVLARYHSTRVN